MSNLKRKRHNFTVDERKIIQELKQELSNTGIPREEWSHQIQQELLLRQKSAKKAKSEAEKSVFQKVVDKIKSKIESIFQKFMAKRMKMDQDAFKELFGDSFPEMGDSEMDLMNAMLSQVEVPKKEQLNKHGTFVAERSDKKRMIIEFDDD